MRSRIIAQSLLTLLAVVLLSAARPVPAGARDSGPAANGSGFFTFQGETTFFTFHAKEHKRGDDKGRARFTNLTTGISVEVRIDCMNGDGSSANFRGAQQVKLPVAVRVDARRRVPAGEKYRRA